MVKKFPPPKSMADDDLSEPPRRADSKNPIFIFCLILGLGHLRGPGVSLGRILGVPSIEPLLGWGGSSQGNLKTPPPSSIDCRVHYLWFAFVCFLIRSQPPSIESPSTPGVTIDLGVRLTP